MIEDGRGKMLMAIRNYRWWWLMADVVGGMGLSTVMVWNGGILKLYNDILTLIGYLLFAMLIYKAGEKVVN